MIIFNKWLLPGGVAAMALGPIIIMRPKHRNNHGLIAHEKHHQKQQKYGLNLPWFLLYLFSRAFRYEQELEAYRIELSYNQLAPEKAAKWLTNNYWLNKSYEEVLEDLTR